MSIENCVCLQGSKRLWTDLSIVNLTKSKDLYRLGCVFLDCGYKITKPEVPQSLDACLS